MMERSGYFYAYLVNESSMNVYFDDFQVTQTTSSVLEENHYYPFGMLNTQLSTSPTENPLNHYKYNGKELQKELNLEWLDYGARFYDAQVGRWHAIDPLAEVSRRWSPYTYGYNSPTTMIDPDGMQAQSVMDLFNQSGEGLTNWDRNDDGSYTRNSDDDTYSSNTSETANSDNPPQGKNNQSSTINQPQGQGGLGASNIFGAAGVAGDVMSMSNSTFRLMSGANGTFSPKMYNSGWNGGSPARINTYSLSKVGTGVSTGANVVTTYMSYNQIYNGEAQPITYVDAGVGTAGILAEGASYFYGVQIPFVGEFVAVYGVLRLTWDVSFYLGTQYGPSKWYGINDNKWFK